MKIDGVEAVEANLFYSDGSVTKEAAKANKWWMDNMNPNNAPSDTKPKNLKTSVNSLWKELKKLSEAFD